MQCFTSGHTHVLYYQEPGNDLRCDDGDDDLPPLQDDAGEEPVDSDGESGESSPGGPVSPAGDDDSCCAETDADSSAGDDPPMENPKHKNLYNQETHPDNQLGLWDWPHLEEFQHMDEQIKDMPQSSGVERVETVEDKYKQYWKKFERPKDCLSPASAHEVGSNGQVPEQLLATDGNGVPMDAVMSVPAVPPGCDSPCSDHTTWMLSPHPKPPPKPSAPSDDSDESSHGSSDESSDESSDGSSDGSSKSMQSVVDETTFLDAMGEGARQAHQQSLASSSNKTTLETPKCDKPSWWGFPLVHTPPKDNVLWLWYCFTTFSIETFLQHLIMSFPSDWLPKALPYMICLLWPRHFQRSAIQRRRRAR